MSANSTTLGLSCSCARSSVFRKPSKQFSQAASSPVFGYLITTSLVRGIVQVPVLPNLPLEAPEPAAEAIKGTWPTSAAFAQMQLGNAYAMVKVSA